VTSAASATSTGKRKFPHAGSDEDGENLVRMAMSYILHDLQVGNVGPIAISCSLAPRF
jgi:hypothetical protein